MPTHRFPVLEARFGPLTPMDAGMQSRVYAAPGGDVVVKVYRNQRGDHRLEAANMRRAGLGAWVVDAVEADGVEALILRRFPGRPLGADDVPAALPRLREIVGALHRAREGQVDVERLRERLRRFRRALAAYPLDDLFGAVELPLERGLLNQPAAFCHLDLWHDNILIAAGREGDGARREVLVIDWTKAGWDDPLRDVALLKTGTLDLLGMDASLDAALTFLPDHAPATLTRLRAYLAHTYLHDLYWFLMNEPYEFDRQRAQKLPRARHVLARLPE
nr:phosphotransferase [Deinococcus budaensis]